MNLVFKSFILTLVLSSSALRAEGTDYFTFPDFRISRGASPIFGQDISYILVKSDEIVRVAAKPFSFTEAQRRQFEDIRGSLNLSKEGRLVKMLDAYIEARLGMFPDEISSFARKAYDNRQVSDAFDTAQYDRTTNTIELPNAFPQNLSLVRAIWIVHELEHSLQNASNAFQSANRPSSPKEFVKFYLKLISLQGDHTPSLEKFAREVFAIGAQWEFARLLSESDRMGFEEEAHDLWIKQSHSDVSTAHTTYKSAPLNKLDAIGLMLEEQGYSIFRILKRNRGSPKDHVIRASLRVLSLGSCGYALYGLGKLASLLGSR